MTKELFPYAVVSAMALAVDVAALYAGVSYLNMPAHLAAALAYAIGLAVHYLLSVRYVFAFRRLAKRRGTEAIVYALTGVGGALLSAVIVYFGTALSQPLVVSKLVAVAASFAVVYLLRKITLFTAPDSRKGSST